MNSIVVHYQEIALKGKNRPWFLRRLVRNLRRAVADLDVTAVRILMGRLEIVLGARASPEQVGERIRHVFGVANFSYAGRATLDLDAIARAILDDPGPDALQARARAVLAELDGAPAAASVPPLLFDGRFDREQWEMLHAMKRPEAPPADPSNAHADSATAPAAASTRELPTSSQRHRQVKPGSASARRA